MSHHASANDVWRMLRSHVAATIFQQSRRLIHGQNMKYGIVWVILSARWMTGVSGLLPVKFETTRRSILLDWSTISVLIPTIVLAIEDEEIVQRPFFSGAYRKAELTNSIIASRDTNVSPMEVYDTLRSQLRKSAKAEGARALDVGAGAGVSTQVLYRELGYTTIDAVDWSGVAWQANVVESGYCPPSVKFYELDDERFVNEWKRQRLPRYDIIAFNFAINKDKALYFCQNLLKSDGLLLAPINIQNDYWLKQSYQLINATGTIVWSAKDVGAWEVLFQPDVTQETCQGIWCSPFNGFQKLKVYSN